MTAPDIDVVDRLLRDNVAELVEHLRGVPPNSQTGNYTAVLADAGKDLVHASGAGAGDTLTIPANASVAYPIGTLLGFVNLDSNSCSIAITSDTLTWAPTERLRATASFLTTHSESRHTSGRMTVPIGDQMCRSRPGRHR